MLVKRKFASFPPHPVSTNVYTVGFRALERFHCSDISAKNDKFSSFPPQSNFIKIGPHLNYKAGSFKSVPQADLRTELSRSRLIVVHGSRIVLQNDLKWIKLIVDVSIVVQKGPISTLKGIPIRLFR